MFTLPKMLRLARPRPRVLGLLLPALLLAGCGGAAGQSGGDAAVAPVLNAFPSPNTRTASPQTQITLRGVPADRIGTVTVTGSASGRHAGRLAADPDGNGASFIPARPFRPGEVVTVQTSLPVQDGDAGGYRFTVSRPAAQPALAPSHAPAAGRGQVDRFVSRPDLRAPAVKVTRWSRRAAQGYVFLGPKLGSGQWGPEIVDGHGRLVWFRPAPAGQRAMTVRVQRFGGHPALVWYQGRVAGGYGQGEGLVADSRYRIVARIRAGNGYRMDLHELRLTDRGTALFTAVGALHWDESSVGGPHDGVVWDTVVQEVDVRTGLVLFEWHSLDHVPLTDSYSRPPSRASTPYDWFHGNSIDVDPAGNLVVSARNTWAVYDVDHRTGAVRWRLGGRHSDFRMGPRTRTAWQHDVEFQPDGTLGIFDNEASPKVGAQSRAIELSLDTQAMTATLAHSFTHPRPLVSGTQASMQRLPNGDVFVGWGSQPYWTEFDPVGHVLIDARFADPRTTSYRAFRSRWTGRPLGRPALAVRERGGRPTAYVSWNGATEVARWELIGGADARHLRPLRTVRRGGFETAIGAPSRGWVAVRALSSAGRVLGTSRARRVPAR